MPPSSCIKLVTAAFATITLFSYCKCINEWEHELILDREGDFLMFWNLSKEDITIEVQVRTKGYVGLGFSPMGGMKGADIVVGWVINSKIILQDRYSADYVEPIIDDNQDYELISGFENDTHTILRFKRLLETCDDQDMPIVNSSMYVIYAWGDDDAMPLGKIEYHGGENRGSKSINLMAPDVELLPITDDTREWDIQLTKVAVPSEVTSYLCHVIKIPPTKKKLHAVGMLLFSQPAKGFQLHHVLMHECLYQFPNLFETEYGVVDSNCMTLVSCPGLITAFGPDRSKVNISPQFGIPFGKPDTPTYYFVQSHYQNPNHRNGSFHQVTIHIMTMEKLRKYDAGTAIIQGYFHAIIPQQQKNFTYSSICPSECTQKNLPVDGINVVTIGLHAHVAARKIYLRHFRDGLELPLLGYDENFDFEHQSFANLKKEVKIMPGDVLAVQCEYNTMDRKNFTTEGLTTDNEMCMAFIVHYPKADLLLCVNEWMNPDIIQILKSARRKEMNNGPQVSKVTSQSVYARNFDELILAKEDINALSNIQTYGKMDATCVNSDRRLMVSTAEYPQNGPPILPEKLDCQKYSRNNT